MNYNIPQLYLQFTNPTFRQYFDWYIWFDSTIAIQTRTRFTYNFGELRQEKYVKLSQSAQAKFWLPNKGGFLQKGSKRNQASIFFNKFSKWHVWGKILTVSKILSILQEKLKKNTFRIQRWSGPGAGKLFAKKQKGSPHVSQHGPKTTVCLNQLSYELLHYILRKKMWLAALVDGASAILQMINTVLAFYNTDNIMSTKSFEAKARKKSASVFMKIWWRVCIIRFATDQFVINESSLYANMPVDIQSLIANI